MAPYMRSRPLQHRPQVMALLQALHNKRLCFLLISRFCSLAILHVLAGMRPSRIGSGPCSH